MIDVSLGSALSRTRTYGMAPMSAKHNGAHTDTSPEIQPCPGRVPETFTMASSKDGSSSDGPRRCTPLFALKVTAFVSCVLCVLFIAVIIALAVIKLERPTCAPGYSVIPRDLENPRVFDGLTPREYISARDYLLNVKSLNVVPFSQASINSSYIYMIDHLMPLKDTVLTFLQGISKQPERTAKAIIIRGDMTPPRVEEYIVGPLPYPTYHKLVTNPSFTKSRIPYSAKPVDKIEYDVLYSMLYNISVDLYPLMYGSYKLSYHNCTKGVDCLLWWDIAPRGRVSGERKTWFWSFRDVEGFYLHPLGLEIQIDHESTNVKEWKVTKIVYNGQQFYEVDDLVTRYGGVNLLRKINYEPLGAKEYLYSSYNRRGKSEMPEPLQGPKLVEPDGRRYRVDGQHVSYMHWDFDFKMRPSTGLQVFDVRFQEERIAYEISLQDAVVFYSGYGPVQGTSMYFDASWMMGATCNELVPGVDCPETAVFLDADFLTNTQDPWRIKNSVCIFENTGNIPLRRHYTNFPGGYSGYAGLVDYHLIVRTITNIWNYDYIFDYIFHQNGAVQVRVSATGYVQATYALYGERKFGYPIYNDVVANIHQHLFNYKVDLDINGVQNSYATLDVSTHRTEVAWSKGVHKTEMVFEKNIQENELDAGPGQLNNTKPKYDVILNMDATSKFKSERGYRILNHGISKFILQENEATKAANWAKYPLSVTKYHDFEDTSSSIYAQNDPWDPLLDFDKFIQNNDSIVNTDIVAWVTMGLLHIPHTEDVPSTTTAGSQVTFYLLPFNYFTECPSVSSPNTVKITPKREGGINLNTHGTSFESTCVQKSNGPDKYDGRLHDVEL